MKIIFVKSTVALLFLLFSLQAPVLASGNSDPERKHFYGTYLGIHMSASKNQFEITPMAGYTILPKFRVAITGKYQFYRNKVLLDMFDSHIYGAGLLADYFIIESLDDLLPFTMHGGIYLHAETELLRLERKHFGEGNNENGRFWHPVYLVGGGFRHQTTDNTALNLAVLFELDINGISLYPTPVIRLGLFF